MDSWYVGIRTSMDERIGGPMEWLDVEVVTGYKTDKPQRELYHHIENRLGSLTGGANYLDRHEQVTNTNAQTSTIEQQADNAMHTIAGIKGEALRAFPDVAFVRIKTANPKTDLAYTLRLGDLHRNGVTRIFNTVAGIEINQGGFEHGRFLL